jgi:hypothetical protein
LRVQVTISRTDIGASTNVRSDSGEASKEYASWDDALVDAQHIGLINTVELTAAKALPPRFSLHTNAEFDLSMLAKQGFISEQKPKPL